VVQANGASSATTPACSKLLKHCRQTASIVGHLERVGLTREPQRTTFIELGAGKATLSEMLAETAGGRGGSYVLIDRDKFRNKRDKFIRGAHKENQCVRHTIDIGNMNMSAMPKVMERDRCVLISKHLCGVATCLALRAAVAMSSGKGEEETKEMKDCATKSKSKSKKNKMCGMALATCCHHRCIWDDYVNQDFFTSAGFSHEDFEMIRRTASWGTSCLGGAKAASSVIVMQKEERREKISNVEKADIGLRCKMVLDIGRLLYLQSAGFECEMVRYVDGTLSPENRLLTATTFANAC
jgi:tRNA:m4X modification enzyme